MVLRQLCCLLCWCRICNAYTAVNTESNLYSYCKLLVLIMLIQLSMFNPSHHQGKALIFIIHKMHLKSCCRVICKHSFLKAIFISEDVNSGANKFTRRIFTCWHCMTYSIQSKQEGTKCLFLKIRNSGSTHIPVVLSTSQQY